ncbi:MAG TPA: hypothetical protein VGS12_18370 [Caulobacteraceae bacterium]|nr:hypothetical protein [Caulobacteraceae bacterium]
MALAHSAPNPVLRSIALAGGFVASLAALAVGALMALFVAAAMFVTALLASALLAFFGAALRARRAVQPSRDPNLLEARNVGGHHWVAYGWDGGR